jgi:colicin import membrane protein
MSTSSQQKYFILSILFHLAIVLICVLGLDVSAPLFVVENTNQHDVISAVILGDSATSKILPQAITPPPVDKKPLKSKVQDQVQIKKDMIALKAAEKLRHDKLAQSLLDDIQQLKKKKVKQQQLKQKELQAQFQKSLKQQTEKSLRQQLLNEEIKLQGVKARQSQGVINKYKALILQAISERWIVPTQANKSLYCELMIRVAPGGMVLDVQVTKSSGDSALDSSARAAVLKASPLPVPPDTEAFEAFRQFVLKVKPENVLG